MRIVIILALLLFSAAAPNDTPRDQLGRAFVEAIKSKDFNKLQKLTPTLKTWRKIAPNETRKLNDRKIKAKLAEFIEPKLRRDFDSIIADAERKDVDLARLEFSTTEIARAADNGKAPIGLEVVYILDGKQGSFALSVAELDGKWYLIEILLSYNVFKQ